MYRLQVEDRLALLAIMLLTAFNRAEVMPRPHPPPCHDGLGVWIDQGEPPG
jgi:hypothetical protein